MLGSNIQPVWRRRVREIRRDFDEVWLPAMREPETPQDQEWCEVAVDGERRRIRFHDYHEVYAVPGLYEHIFYHMLRCCSPSRVVWLLREILEERGQSTAELRVLDVGAGNGMVADELAEAGVPFIVGVDIIAEAREAAMRDRPRLYDHYFVEDLTDLSEGCEQQLRHLRLNAMTTVAALGFGDIPPAAFLKALDLVETPAWLAFNIKEHFLSRSDATGFAGLVQALAEAQVMRIEAYRRYRHRLSTSGSSLYYLAMVARKLRDIPDGLMEQESETA